MRKTWRMAGTASPKAIPDVLVVGAGIAGLATATMAARAGLGVVCVDPDPPPRERVGESLDWAAPTLLDRIGLPVHRIVANRLGTWKREVQGVPAGGPRLVGRPTGWMGRWPLRFRLETVHVDRGRFDAALYEAASSAGVRFVCDGVARVDVDPDRVVRCWTRSGEALTARWFIDGSGRSRLFARAFGIDRIEYGPTRMAIWAKWEAPPRVDGTVLQFDDGPGDLRWAWRIPLTPLQQSVGVVIPETEFRERRRRLGHPAEIMACVLAGLPGVTTPQVGEVHGVRARAVRCYTHRRVTGRNWLMVGEAASFVDPLTSTGVSAAMRHGIEAAEIIQSAPRRRVDRALRRFDRRVRCMATLYNEAVQELLYSPDVRRRIGMRRTARAYVILGFGMSALYTRLGGTGPVRHVVVIGLAGGYRLWLRSWLRLARSNRRAGPPTLHPPRRKTLRPIREGTK